jgi:hypothetical protein
MPASPPSEQLSPNELEMELRRLIERAGVGLPEEQLTGLLVSQNLVHAFRGLRGEIALLRRYRPVGSACCSAEPPLAKAPTHVQSP